MHEHEGVPPLLPVLPPLLTCTAPYCAVLPVIRCTVHVLRCTTQAAAGGVEPRVVVGVPEGVREGGQFPGLYTASLPDDPFTNGG